jgi:hypothetical protein
VALHQAARIDELEEELHKQRQELRLLQQQLQLLLNSEQAR